MEIQQGGRKKYQNILIKQSRSMNKEKDRKSELSYHQ